ncbi:MAG TPA: iron-sulfur cluster-binding domain-containing protein [Puia sp.]|jgi:ring-1,2-phenylacetyl-CoA epoxidase subunit PaaE|nr:iron-sulfur cluster-binding domain-containing protein [Puia sp.]
MENWIWQVTAIVPEAAGTKTISLERRSREPAPYQAGQFLTLLFTSHGHEIRRSYSFSTAPGIDAFPAITVKRVPNGEISRHLLDHLRVGDALTTLPPAGRFTLTDIAENKNGKVITDLVFIAAGSGVVPVFSLLKQALILPVRPLLLTQQHDVGSTPFRAAMQAMPLNWTEMLTVRDGRLTKDKLAAWVTAAADGGDIRFYLCGPPDFMRMVQITLRTLGFPDNEIRREHFTTGHIPPAPPVFDATPKTIRVRAAVDHEFVVTWPDSILTAAIRQGVPLPYSCRAGRCSSCVAHCIRGRVRMAVNEVLTERDLAEGLVLTCVGYAETDVELDYSISSAAKAIGSSDPDSGMT